MTPHFQRLLYYALEKRFLLKKTCELFVNNEKSVQPKLGQTLFSRYLKLSTQTFYSYDELFTQSACSAPNRTRQIRFHR